MFLTYGTEAPKRDNIPSSKSLFILVVEVFSLLSATTVVCVYMEVASAGLPHQPQPPQGDYYTDPLSPPIGIPTPKQGPSKELKANQEH